MFNQFLRENHYVSWLLTVFRVYLGVNWLKASWGKITGGHFDASGFLNEAVNKGTGEHPMVQPCWGNFLQEVALPHVEIFNVLVPWGEFLVGIALIFGILTKFSVLMGMTMNFAYLFSGTTSRNPQMVLIGMFILVASMNAGKVGIDGWITLYFEEVDIKKGRSRETPTRCLKPFKNSVGLLEK